jgi:hypothetical protein
MEKKSLMHRKIGIGTKCLCEIITVGDSDQLNILFERC